MSYVKCEKICLVDLLEAQFMVSLTLKFNGYTHIG